MPGNNSEVVKRVMKTRFINSEFVSYNTSALDVLAVNET
jgi:hypothetical protein